MNKFRFEIKILAIAIFMFAFASMAQAQAMRTWVSGVGDDANPCSRTAPCKTYAGAISKTAINGEINCLDPGGFGQVTIVKSISIVCDYTEGGVLASSGSGFVINAPAGSNITLKGQDVDCFGTGANGVNIVGEGVTVHIHKFQIRNCRAGNGILVAPSSGQAKVFVADSYITDNGAGVSNAGILIKATSGASANVSINRVQFENNTNGIFANDSGGGGAANINVKDSILSGSSNSGIVIVSNSSAITAMVDSTMISFNINTGAAVAGSGENLRLGGNTISKNVTGVDNIRGTLQSFKNNQVVANSTDGTPIPAVSVSGSVLN